MAQEKGLRLGVAPDTFLGASVQTAKYIVDTGLIGTPLSCRASISRDYGAFGEFLSHLYKKGGGIALDMGGYYLTALVAILGPAHTVGAFTAIHEPVRTNSRIGPMQGRRYELEVPNVLSAVIQYENGVLSTLHMNSDTLIDEKYCLEIYGTDGVLSWAIRIILAIPWPSSGSSARRWSSPLTHGFDVNSRGLSAAEMAWSIRANSPHRASKEMAYHVFEMLHGMMISAGQGSFYQMESTFTIPEMLPAGFIGNSKWIGTEERALV